MTAEGLEVAQLTPMMVERFLAGRRRQGRAVMISPRGSRPLLGFLEGLGVLAPEDRARSSVELFAGGLPRLSAGGARALSQYGRAL